jgi:hypothetical protein
MLNRARLKCVGGATKESKIHFVNAINDGKGIYNTQHQHTEHHQRTLTLSGNTNE